MRMVVYELWTAGCHEWLVFMTCDASDPIRPLKWSVSLIQDCYRHINSISCLSLQRSRNLPRFTRTIALCPFFLTQLWRSYGDWKDTNLGFTVLINPMEKLCTVYDIMIRYKVMTITMITRPSCTTWGNEVPSEAGRNITHNKSEVQSIEWNMIKGVAQTEEIFVRKKPDF